MKIFKAVLPSLIILVLGANVSALYAQTIPTSFSWTSTGPLISPKNDSTHNMIAVKDPSTVYYNGQYIVYASSVNSAGNYGMEYLHFTDWSQTGAATPYFMDSNPNIGSGYHTAPQVFYFAPQKKWYLIFQSGQPQYSTNSDPTQPQNWTTPTNFFASQPSSVSNWIDFWIISDSSNVYLFFCGDNGNFYRSSTSLANFPNGFNTPVIVYSDSEFNLFEADNVYTVEQTGTYLADIECIGSDGHRFFRALTATTLGGTWTSLGNTASLNTPFLGAHNVTFQSGVSSWTSDFSSGGAVIDGYDSTDSINLNNLTFLYQGDVPNSDSYNLIPWQLALVTSKANTTTNPTATFTFTHTNTPVPPTFTPTPIVSSTWRVNAGGPAYTGTTGLLWAADENYSGGSTAAEGGAVTGTSDSTLYDTQRYGNSFSYSFNVPAGAYQVTLKFAENYSGDFANGDRVFNVAINGTTVLANLDVYAQVGSNTADDKVINNVSPSGGVITIQFTGTSSADTSAMVEAIQVIPQPATPTSTFTPTLTRTGTPTFTSTPAVTNTATFTRTNTAIPPTATKTNSPVPPTITNTPAPPTVTNTPAPPTATGTNTPVPPTATSTNTPVPPTATRTNTPVPPTATPTAVVSGASFEVQLLSSVTSATTNSPHPQIQIVNIGSGPLSLNSVTVRYWFNCDCTTQTIQAWVDWAGLVPSGSTVSSNVKVSSQSTTLGGQTSYILYSFSGNMVLQPGQAIQVQSRFNKSDWSNFTQSEDWSYAANTSYANDSKATGYMNGALVWGQEPSGTAASMSVSNVAVQTPAAGQGLSVKAYPNPSAGNGVNLSVTLPGNGGGASSSVMAKVYTLEGRLVWSTAMPASSSGSSGNRAVYWNEKDLSGNNLANGLYVVAVVVKSQGKTSTAFSKVLILR